MLRKKNKKKTNKIIRKNAFEKEKKPGLSTNRPSNNWAQGFGIQNTPQESGITLG